MKNLCFYFQVHQPFRLRQYRFFDIGADHNYFDTQKNQDILRKVASKCYLPANQVLLDLIQRSGGRFKVSFSISGTAIDQFRMYAPEVIESFQRLAATGCVEFLAETYSHSLSALVNPGEFIRQVSDHASAIKTLFGQSPKVFRNTELIYSDNIGAMIRQLGFEVIITEGADHILGWKSPNYIYRSAQNPSLKLLLKNYRLSDDIAFRFSHADGHGVGLTAESFINRLNAIPPDQQIVNLFMDYETFGEHQWEASGIFDFMRALPQYIQRDTPFSFATLSEAVAGLDPVAEVSMPYPVSWADEERDLSAWLGNDLQDNAFESLYKLSGKVKKCQDDAIQRDWRYLQTSDHFYYMCTKFFADGDVHKYFNPYQTPYQAYINYMNVLSDFEGRVNETLIMQRRSGRGVSAKEQHASPTLSLPIHRYSKENVV